jgi:hypothetical protein
LNSLTSKARRCQPERLPGILFRSQSVRPSAFIATLLFWHQIFTHHDIAALLFEEDDLQMNGKQSFFPHRFYPPFSLPPGASLQNT